MSDAKPTTVDQYIAGFPPDVRAILEKIRETVRKSVPDAEEVISYQMPAFKYHGMLLYYAAFRDHYSIFAAAARDAPEFRERLAPYRMSKGTLRFPLDKRVPVGLIRDIARYGAKHNVEREAARTAKRKRPV